VREPENPTPSSTPAGTLLIAHPGLLDPNFHKTVLFISSWDGDGAFGLVLNRPASRTVAELLPGRDDLGALGALPVFLGGPVSRDQLIFAAFQWHSEKGALECRHHVSLAEAEELAHKHSTVIRAFIGYAGWGKGQLESEIAQSAWLLKPAERDVLDPGRSELVWRDLLATFGPKYRLISEAPDDPGRN
jgi:putative transcriptional regulator